MNRLSKILCMLKVLLYDKSLLSSLIEHHRFTFVKVYDKYKSTDAASTPCVDGDDIYCFGGATLSSMLTRLYM